MSAMFNPVVIGMIIGFLPAVVGGVVSYWGYIKNPSQNTGGVLILLLSTTGALILTGAIAFVIGLISGELTNVALIGMGVFIGFALGFGLMLMLYLRIDKVQDDDIPIRISD